MPISTEIYSKEDLAEALRAINSISTQTKLREGTPQHTLQTST